MSDDVYKRLCEEMARRGGRYPGKDIPEFYSLVEELFTKDEAAIAALMNSRMITPGTIATTMSTPGRYMAATRQAASNWSAGSSRCLRT